MKKIYNYFLIAIAFLVFAPFNNVHAQKQTTYKNGLGYSKNISTPDDEGVYTITLEAFTTGKVEVEKKSIPADIVLVLDVSGSMEMRQPLGILTEITSDWTLLKMPLTVLSTLSTKTIYTKLAKMVNLIRPNPVSSGLGIG